MESNLVVWVEVHRALGLQAVESTGRTERDVSEKHGNGAGSRLQGRDGGGQYGKWALSV